MKIMKKVILVIICIILSVQTIGCDIFSKDVSSIKNKEPITLTIFLADLTEPMEFDTEVAKKITEITGVTLEFIYPEDGFSKPIDLMIAGETYPDLIYAKGDTGKLVDARAIMKLDDYIEEKGDNIKDLYGDQLNRLRYSLEDPSIYTVGTYGVSSKNFDPEGTLKLQHRVLKELGYPKIKTINDYENALKEYIEKYPTINGQKTIGLSLMASDWRWIITCGNAASSAAGIPDDGQFKIDDETQEAVYKFQLPEVKEYFKWLNHLYAEGLLDPESFTQSEEEYKNKLLNGNVLGIADPKWDYPEVIAKLITEEKFEYMHAPLPVTINEQYKDQSLKDYGFSGGWGIAISKACKDKERAFEFLDWMASDEAQVLINWGIEGRHYKIENGKRVAISEPQEDEKESEENSNDNSGVGEYIYPFPQRGDGAIDPTGNSYTTNTIENYIKKYTPVEKETLKAYNAKSWADLFPQPEELGKSKHGQQWQYTIPSDSDMAIIQAKADAYVQTAITEAIIGKEEDFDAVWDNIQKELDNIGISKLNDGMTELTKEKIKLWNN